MSIFQIQSNNHVNGAGLECQIAQVHAEFLEFHQSFLHNVIGKWIKYAFRRTIICYSLSCTVLTQHAFRYDVQTQIRIENLVEIYVMRCFLGRVMMIKCTEYIFVVWKPHRIGNFSIKEKHWHTISLRQKQCKKKQLQVAITFWVIFDTFHETKRILPA